jgi:hypothetical protein
VPYLFYNFAAEQADPEFLKQFIPAIGRTIQYVEQNSQRFPPDDIADLYDFLDYVKQLERTA